MVRFISFGGPSVNYHRAVNRIVHEAKETQLFSSIKGYTDKDLKEDPKFWNYHGKMLETNKRGFGFWLWKPYLIKKNLDAMKEGELLFYADAGCQFSLNKPKQYLIDRFNRIRKEKKIIGCFTCPERSYNKMDLVKLLDMETHPKYLKGGQHAATAFLLIKTPEICKLVDQWWSISTQDNYRFINDSPSKYPNSKHFKDHRHDQSIYSLLTKKYDLFSSLSIRSDSAIFNTPRKRGGPIFCAHQKEREVTDIVKKFLVNGVLSINRRYNHLFSDISFGNKKELVIHYTDSKNQLQIVDYLENRPINIADIKNINKAIYRVKSGLKCLVNV